MSNSPEVKSANVKVSEKLKKLYTNWRRVQASSKNRVNNSCTKELFIFADACEAENLSWQSVVELIENPAKVETKKPKLSTVKK